MKKLTLGLQLYSVRDFLEKDFMGTLERVKEMGYNAVEFAGGFYGHTAKEVKAKCDELGLLPISAHADRKDLLKEETVAAYAGLGCKFVVLSWSDWRTEFVGSDGYEDYKRDITKISAECRKYGIRLLYHNHDFEFVKLDGEYKLDIFYKDLPAEVLQTELDTCWISVGGEDPEKYLCKYAGRAPLVHLKDFVGEDGAEPFDFRPLGYGSQNVMALIKAATDAGAEGIIIEQDRPSMGKTSLECAQMSIEYIKSLL